MIMGMDIRSGAQFVPAGLTVVTVTIWLSVWLGLLIFAANAPHVSLWELILPSSDALSWITPGALVIPPILLVCGRLVSRPQAIFLAWVALGFSALPVLGVLALLIFPVETSYYDPADPERQPGSLPTMPAS